MQHAIAPAMFEQHQIRPTTAGAHLTPVTSPQHRALAAAATDGRVYRGPRFSVRVLTALARKGFLTLTAHPGPRRSNWAYGQITEAGRRELARLDAAAAEAAGREHRAAAPVVPPVSITGQADPFGLCRDRHTAAADMIDRVLAGAR